MNDKILLIGGGGYVGTVIADYFLKSGFEVNVLDNFTYQHSSAIDHLNGSKNFKLYKAEMDDFSALEKAANGIKNVVLLSGLVGDPITKKYPQTANLVNDIKVRKCIDYFDDKDIDRFIFTSTCSNYGLIPEDQLADEKYELNPLSLYAKSKVAAENYLLEKKGKVFYKGTILRFATAFGLSARMRFDLTISEFVRDLYFGRELLVFDEHTWRPYCHVNDFSRLIKKVISAPDGQVAFEVFNAGGDENNFTKKMIVDCILDQIPDGKVKYSTAGSDPRNYRVSFDRVKQVLNFEPNYSVQFGISELISAFNEGKYLDALDNPNDYGNFVINDAS